MNAKINARNARKLTMPMQMVSTYECIMLDEVRMHAMD